MKLYKNLPQTQIEGIKRILNNNNFKEIAFGSFLYGNRVFRFQSDYLTGDFGLETYVNLDNILAQMPLKTKHTSSLLNKIEEERSIDTAFMTLGWKVTDMISEFDFIHKYGSNNEEDIYEVDIRGKKHIVYNEQVFEGELKSISELFRYNAIEILHNINPEILHQLKTIGMKY